MSAIISKERPVTIAHYLTFFRILISPIFLIVYLQYDESSSSAVNVPLFLLSLLCLSEFSDALDGHLARRYNQVTELGKLLDPMADSISRLSIFLTFTGYPVQIPMLLVFLFIYRDVMISTLRTICALRGITLGARPSGKIKAVVQASTAFTIVLLLIWHANGTLSTEMLQSISTSVVAVAAIYSVYSGVEYALANWTYISKLLILQPVKMR